MARKMYIGYDLGDGETITDCVSLETDRLAAKTKTEFKDMTMPDTTSPGHAMPTIFAFDESGTVIFSQTITANPEAVRNIVVNFKRRPSDLLKSTSGKTEPELIEFLESCSSWPSASVWPDGNTTEMQTFKNSVVTFTNAIFSDANYINRLKSAAQTSDEIVFCVGHPTNWSELDIAIYELVLKSSVLGRGAYEGKKSSIIMEAESRAAFLYSKDVEAFGKLPKGSSVLLIDIGSSTIDITAMTAASNNHQYNSGNNYLGARSIDFMIRDWYLKQLQQDPANWSIYQKLVRDNPTIPNALTLACRLAKERLYSSPAGLAVIHFSLFPGIRLTKAELDQVIDNTPIANILRETILLSDQECARMGDKTWKVLFKEFLSHSKEEMTRKGIQVCHIILTGSASKMPFVPRIVREVFNEVLADSLQYDMNPSRTISKGLALVGPSDEKSKAFQNDLNQLIDQKLEKIVEENIPALGKEVGPIISDILTPKMKSHIKDWKAGKTTTLNDMNRKIKADCSEANLAKVLPGNPKYTRAIENWLKNSVGRDIAIELKGLCDKYGVRDISVDDLNIMTAPEISVDKVHIDPLAFMDSIGAIIALIGGIVTAASATTILAVIIVVVSYISQTVAALIFAALIAMGPVGIGIIALILGISVTVLIARGVSGFKALFQEKVMDWDLPEIARNTVSDNKIDKSLADAKLPQQIEDAFKKEKLKKDIAKKVSVNLKGQIEKRAEDIKYAIESR